MFPGFVLVALALVGLARHARSDSRPLAVGFGVLAAAGALLSFGPEGARWMYAALHDNVFGFQAIRAPARFSVLVVAGLAGLAALAIRQMPATWLRAAVLAALCLEYVNAPLPLAAAPAMSTPSGAWLAREPQPGAVLYLPIGVDIENTPYMVQSLEHGRDIVNGYSGQRPAYYTSLVESLADLPSPAAFALLREIDVRFVVSPTPIAGAGNPRSPLVERARGADGLVYEVRWTPESLGALDEIDVPDPPPPGPPPFTAGEVMRFDVYWDGGPLDVPAGTATMTVLDGEPGAARWEFETRAETAPWVSTFFEARDRFVTVTDGEFLPVEHRREIREGRRVVDRRYVYDRAANLVQGDVMALPLGAPEARDAFAALYYVRTLPLEPSSIVTVPLNEAGAALLLQVAVAETERITHGGREVAALRLEPRVMRRIERRRPVSITLWLSADPARVPLRALVDAGFGRIRLELREHRR
jgi:hypothetical protein